MHTCTPTHDDLIARLDDVFDMGDIKAITVDEAHRLITITVYIPDREDPHYKTITLNPYGSMIVMNSVSFFTRNGYPVNQSSDRTTYFLTDWQAVSDHIAPYKEAKQKADAIAAKR